MNRSEVRGPVVRDADHHLFGIGSERVLDILLLQNTVAFTLCAANEAERRVSYPMQLTRALMEECTGLSPHEAHAHTAYLGWLWPTLKTSEYTVLQIVGLDAAVVRANTNILQRLVY